MRIYITGIAGFLGSNLANHLSKLGHEVLGNDNMIGGEKENLSKDIVRFDNVDCCNFEKMSECLRNIDIVYHCAATAHEGLSVFSPKFITQNIYDASVSTITAAIVNKVKRFVYCSSMARYGVQKTPYSEEMPTLPEDPYGIAKVAGEQTLKILAKVHGMEWNIAVPHNIVGPNQKYDDPYRNVMSIMINRNLQGQPSIIYGDGEQTRCFSYIDDVIYCLDKLALDKDIKSEIVNVGPDEDTISINNLANLVANSTGFNERPIYVASRPQEVKHASCSSDKARKLLGYKTKTTLTEAVDATTEFIRKRGVKPFKYHLPLEIINDITPKTWKDKLI